jgi:hypothetical protein
VVRDGALVSTPDTVVIEVINRPPVADAGSQRTIKAGEKLTLDGRGSFDPDGDALAFDWRTVEAPEGSRANLEDAGSTMPGFRPDVAGDYIIRLNVDDGELSASDEVVITATAPRNLPPELAPVGNHSVALGETLKIDVTADDPNGDALEFVARPLPLPEGARLDGQSGVFTFAPRFSQIGELSLTFVVSDGTLSDAETITITVEAPEPGAPTSLAAGRRGGGVPLRRPGPAHCADGGRDNHGLGPRPRGHPAGVRRVGGAAGALHAWPRRRPAACDAARARRRRHLRGG